MHQVDRAGDLTYNDAIPPPPANGCGPGRGRHDSTFSSTPMELAVAIDAFLARLPGPDVSYPGLGCWAEVDKPFHDKLRSQVRRSWARVGLASADLG